MSEWNLPQYAILKCLISNNGKVENPLTIEKIPEEVRKFIREEEIAGELYVLLNIGKIKIEKDGEKAFYVVTEECKDFVAYTEEQLKELEQANEKFVSEQLVSEEAKKPLTVENLLDILGITVKRDNINKTITFLCMLSAYTKNSQFNISFRAPSSTGKSYIPIELADLFEDVVMIAYSSPTAFYHDTGNWDDEKQAIVIDLERKILIFLDQPHDELLRRLRPLLSHDQKELLYKVTDKRETKGLRTKNVIIRGFPSVIFCTGSLKVDEQEATRNFILSPETTQEKIRESLLLKAMRKGNPLAFEEFLESKPERELLKKRISEIRRTEIRDVIIQNLEKVTERFFEKYTKLKPRHTRDIERLISLIQNLALLNLWCRTRDAENNLYVSDEDIETAFGLFDQIAESQELGIAPYIYILFKDVINPLYREKQGGVTRKEIATKHYELYGRTIQDWYLRREIIPALESAGLVYQEPDPEDKRRMLIYVTTTP